jgi:hypothetical protein
MRHLPRFIGKLLTIIASWKNSSGKTIIAKLIFGVSPDFRKAMSNYCRHFGGTFAPFGVIDSG